MEDRKTESWETGSPGDNGFEGSIGRCRAGDLEVRTGCRKAEDANRTIDSRRKS